MADIIRLLPRTPAANDAQATRAHPPADGLDAFGPPSAGVAPGQTLADFVAFWRPMWAARINWATVLHNAGLIGKWVTAVGLLGLVASALFGGR